MLRAFIALFLSLMLVFTSVSMAVARGQSPDIGADMVVCTGVGMLTISIGPDGEPVQTPHICPDAMGLFGMTQNWFLTLKQPGTMQWRVLLVNDTNGQPQESLSPTARAPPLVV